MTTAFRITNKELSVLRLVDLKGRGLLQRTARYDHVLQEAGRRGHKGTGTVLRSLSDKGVITIFDRNPITAGVIPGSAGIDRRTIKFTDLGNALMNHFGKRPTEREGK